jgi:hypothetical protein
MGTLNLSQKKNIYDNLATVVCFLVYEGSAHMIFRHESARERIPRGLPRGKRANGEHNYSLWIEDSPQFTAESFN